MTELLERKAAYRRGASNTEESMKCLNVIGSLTGRFSGQAPHHQAQSPKHSTANLAEKCGRVLWSQVQDATSWSIDHALGIAVSPPSPGGPSPEP